MKISSLIDGNVTHSLGRLELLADIANTLLQVSKPESVLQQIFGRVSAHLGLEVFFCHLIHGPNERLRLSAHAGLSEGAAEKWQWLDFNEALCGTVAHQRTRIIAEDVPSDENPKLDLVRSLDVYSYACFPLLAHGQLMGIVSFGTRLPRRFQSEELAMIESVAHQVAVAIGRQQAEEQLQELNQKLESRVQDRTAQLQETNDQMEAFCYSISHDLRAPLRAIRGFSQALMEDCASQLDAAGQEYLQRIGAGVERMDHLIQDILDYSRLGRAKLTFQPIDLDQCIDAVLDGLSQDIAAKKASVTVKKPLGWVEGHAATLEQAITNLVTNALKFVARGETPRISIRTESKPDGVRLWVEDNGIGIAPQFHDRIFGVFERLHGADVYPGTGIGLAIVAKAVARMNGSAGVDSLPGEGSAFWIELPGSPGKRGEPKEKKEKSARAAA